MSKSETLMGVVSLCCIVLVGYASLTYAIVTIFCFI